MNSDFLLRWEKMHYIDRKTGEKQVEKVYYEGLLRFFYGENRAGQKLAKIFSSYPFFSKFFGFLQTRPFSKRKIAPFIEKYQIDSSEFQKPPETFSSFNDFFTRTLKKEARPIDKSDAVIPADGRFLFYQDITACDGFVVKGEKFSLATLLGSQTLAKRYEGGSMVIGRLNPTDYHRFHFPCDNHPSDPRLINGWLYSVNPIALKQNLNRFINNKRSLTTLESEHFGPVLFIEIGATNVGSIHQTFTPRKQYKKGEEKGYFSFGGSALVLLFEKNNIVFDQDLVFNSSKHTETLCLMGQSLGIKK
ncbi:MAG: Phosphatidylserine decarboxylase proenzyme 2 [Chlamydiales bacterium]|nr:Phosphatidylserine decarboxylase proenzyme 2 [Chlamydiales bacterium]MCH9619644.1 Phosphatidylserine decarboxylase proenzyme 2 [Chlamydiales bacterium]MCH9623250.1 Phosphatidylserine decarboxylase proenzyme 2 [Chlamydiales bacterium]